MTAYHNLSTFTFPSLEEEGVGDTRLMYPGRLSGGTAAAWKSIASDIFIRTCCAYIYMHYLQSRLTTKVTNNVPNIACLLRTDFRV